MQPIDTLIKARWIIPVEPDDVVYDQHAVAVHEGRILDVLPATEAESRFQPAVSHTLSEHALIPGLVNSHTHAAMTLFRGLADDLPLMEWLNDHIWPAERRWISDEFVQDGVRLAAAEMLRGGTTCFNDMYFFPDDTGRAATAVGVRAVVGLIVIDFPTVWARDADEYLMKGLDVHDQFRADPLVHTAFAPHAPYTVADAPLERIGVLAEELDIPIHMHVHETDDEIRSSLESHGKRPLARLDDIGLLSPRLMAVHMTHVEEAEIARVADCNASVVHAPESNLKLASGFCPVSRFQQLGVNVALGTDGAASNNDLDMLSETRTAALLGKAVAGSPSAIAAHTSLRMATLNGARALGIDHITGSLEAGKSADMVAIDLGQLETQPVYHPISQVVYAGNRRQVSDVWVAGRHVLKDRALVTVDEAAVIAKAKAWRERIWEADRHGGECDW
ncbi:MAG: TRZ/ATZ family hydrolase [Gammaproteobacteria bacterium]|nr:TRZ/ATZ family hydrolase [Gammaproteobacteria bacterium]